MKNTFRSRFRWIFMLAIAMLVVVPFAAFADNLKDDVTAGGNDTFTAGGSTIVNYWIQATGSGNTCDASDGSSATVTINVPAGVTASPSSLIFSACNTSNEGNPNNTKSVTFSSTTPGNYSITASVSDSSGDYNSNPADFTLHVNAPAIANQTITFGALANKTYGDADFTVSASASSGLTVSFAAAGNCTISGSTVHITGAGSCTITASQAGNESYNAAPDVSQSFNIAKAAATCTVSGYSGVYDAAFHGASGSCSGVDGESAGTLVIDATTYKDVPGGLVHWVFTGNGNYNNQSGDAEVVISKAAATCTVSGYSGVYDAAFHGASGSCSGIGGESAGTLDLGETFKNVPGGTAHWFFTGNGNYNDQSGVVAINIIAWTLNGFYQPVDMGGVLNTVKGGSTVPLKFEVFAGTTEKTATTVVKSFVQTKINCDSSAQIDEIEVTSTGGTSLRYDGTAGQFIQNWQTPKAPGACYSVTVTTEDGSKLSANFKLK
jgi:hypothetical protein